MNKLKYLAAVVIGIAGLGLQQANANVYSFNLNLGNPGISGFPGPYANVTINLTDSHHATITFTSLTNGGNIYLMGDGSTVALNVNAGSFSVGAITANNGGGGTPGPFTANFGSQQVDGWGHFNFTIDSHDGFTHSSDSITFTLTNISGTWGSAQNVLALNDALQVAASHIFVAAIINGVYTNLNATGYASGQQVVTLPDGGATLMLLGAGLGALGLARRFLRT